MQIDPVKKERMIALIDALNSASLAYYGGKEEVMSNYEWDSLFDELLALENETGLVLEDSPTHNTGITEKNNNRDVHEYPALSLAKTKKVSELCDWAGERDIYLSYKLDGLTLVLTYDNGTLSKIMTRGDGVTGSNITYLKDAISGFPVNITYKGHLVIRGEAVITYKDFEEINSLFEDEDDKYANPRNLASGTLSLDDPQKVKERHVSFNAFTLVHIDDDIKDWGDRMDFLINEGFKTVEFSRCNAQTLPALIDEYTLKVEDGRMDIPVDGLVICYADNDYANTGSVTGHHATRAGLAFKWADVSAFSKLKYIEWSCAASTISPVAVFESVELEGTNVSRASLCNISEMERLGIGDECTVEVIKANKIIPKCISVKDSSGHFVIPSKCPVCEAETRVNISPRSGTKTLQCVNPDCPAKQGKKFTRFVSKSGMDIDGLSIQTMIKFMNVGFIKEFDDIYRLNEHADAIRSMEGFGDKSVDNMMNSITASRNVKAVNFIYALCIPMIGLDAAKKLVGTLGFDGFIKKLEDGLGFEQIDGIGPERSSKITEWFKDSKNAEMLKRLLNEVNILEGEAKDTSGGALAGITFVITGDVHIFKNRDEFKAFVEERGGKVAGSVSAKTAFLVNNDIESTSSKNKKANELGIPIISEDEFMSRFGN
ncbi:MAG: NAD-dependent DNA ligase LigA [Lachnospiraceae bacterium]|nr:NAD-dependent DNA ligase LigA [Lachnospiraceae bacterium]